VHFCITLALKIRAREALEGNELKSSDQANTFKS
jgi:hypothetical protein